MPVFNNVLAGAAGQGGAADYKIERSLRFDSGSSSKLTRTPSSAGNSKTWTLSFWIKRSKIGDEEMIFSAAESSSNRFHMFFPNADSISVYDDGSWYMSTSALARDPSAWMHLVFACDTTQSTATDRFKIYVNGVLADSFSSRVDPPQNRDTPVNSAILHQFSGRGYNTADHADVYLADVHFIDGQALAETDFGKPDDNGVWQPIEYSGTYGTNGFHLDFSDNSSNAALGTDSSGNSNNWTVNNLIATTSGGLAGSASINDGGSPSEGTAYANIWNGSVSSYPGDFLTAANGGEIILQWSPSLTNVTRIEYYTQNGYDRHKVNNGSWSGQSSSSGGWVDAYNSSTAISVSKLSLQKNDQVSYVKIGGIRINGVHAVTLSPSDIDTLTDSPTNSESDAGTISGNYCVLNPIDSKSATLSNGNLEAQVDSSGDNFVRGTIAVSSGKWYYEFTTLSSNNMMLGAADVTADGNYNNGSVFAYYANGGALYGEASGKASSWSGSTLAVGDTLGVALDMDAGTLQYYKNGSLIGTAWTGLTGRTIAPYIGTGGGSGNKTAFNAGQRAFSISSVPTGFKSLCTQNLDDPLIADGSTAFDVKVWTGDGSSSRAITGLNLSPGLLWVKRRNTALDHFLWDSIRGVTKELYSNENYAEGTATNKLVSLDSNGFTVKNNSAVNANNDTYVAWAWDGGNLASNSAYIQTEVWSDKCSGTSYNNSLLPVNTFDGTTATINSAANGHTITFTPTNAIPVSSSIKIYYDIGSITGVSGSADFTINGTSYVATANSNRSNGHMTITGISSITSMAWERVADNDLVAVRQIEVDGKILVDAGLVPVGSLNSTVYNTSQNRSVSGSNMQNNWSDSFDGGMDDFAIPNTGYSSSMTFPSAISYQTLELVVSRDIYGPDLLVNGNSLNVPATDTNTTGGRYKIERYYYTNGTLTSIGHETRNTAGRGGSGFWQIIVDGKILVDTNQASSAPNVPSIATTCTSNPTAGFAISTYKGNSTDRASIAHNLGSTPEMVIVKARNKSDDWRVYHVGAGNPYYLRLQLTNSQNGTNNWREMSLNYFALDADSAVNSSSYDYVAYSFSSIEGYSLVSSYQGQNSFVYCGFRPRFLLIKSATSTEHWAIYDTERSPSNHADDILKPNSNDDEDFNYGSGEIDILSNGFKLRGNWGAINHGSAPTYVFLAIAENPFKTARAR